MWNKYSTELGKGYVLFILCANDLVHVIAFKELVKVFQALMQAYLKEDLSKSNM